MATDNHRITLTQQLKAETFWGRLKSQRLGLILVGIALCLSAFLAIVDVYGSDVFLKKISSCILGRDSNATSKQYKKRLELLSEEIVRVKRYERQLQRKAEEVDSAIAKAKRLSLVLKSSKKSRKSSSNLKAEMGIGGGDDDTAVRMVNQILTLGMVIDNKTGEVKTRPLYERLALLSYKVNHTPIGTPVVGKVSSHYGMRRNPFRGRGRWQFHKGMDIVGPWKTPVVATASGVIETAMWKGGYGRMVVINHGNGIKTRFGHLSEFKVKKGDQVTRGQVIGLMGSTGRSTGTHLHYEVCLAGKAVNPAPFIDLSETLAKLAL